MPEDTNSCSHTRYVPEERIEKWEQNWYTGDMEMDIYIEDAYYETAFVDIDTHRMKCTKCGIIEYYSSYGRSLHEND